MTRRPVGWMVWAVMAGMLAALPPGAGATGFVDGLRYRAELVVPPRTADELVAVRVDGTAAADGREGYADLRVVDGHDREVSSILRARAVVTARSVRRSFRVANPTLEPTATGGLVIGFSIDPAVHDAIVHGFRILTPLVNFQQRIGVERREADGSWTTLVADALLADYSQWMDVRTTGIPLPADSRDRAGGTYRLTVDTATAEQQSQVQELVRSLEGGRETGIEERTLILRQPFRIDGIEVWHDDPVTELRPADPVERRVTDWSVVEDPREKVTRIRVATTGGPVTGFTLAIVDRNVSRDVTVMLDQPRAPGDAAPDRPARPPLAVGHGRLVRLDLRGLAREQLEVPISATWKGPFEIVIANGDSPPLRVTGVTARGPASEVVFLAAPGEDYRLAYGAPPGADPPTRPRYDTAAIDTALAAGRIPVEVAVGTQAEVPFAAPPLSPWRALANPWLLGSVIALLAVALAAALFQAARRIDHLPADGAAPGAPRPDVTPRDRP